MNALEWRVTDAIARRRDDLTRLLCDLVAFDTRTPDPDYAPRDEAALQEYVAGRMRAVRRAAGGPARAAARPTDRSFDPAVDVNPTSH